MNTNRIAAEARGRAGNSADLMNMPDVCAVVLEFQNGGFGMTDPNLDIVRLSHRISALEKANRRWKMGGLVLFVILVAAASLTGYRAYGQMSAPATPKTVPNAVAAREFVLMGPHNRIMGRIAVVAGKPQLQFYDDTGRLWWYAPPKMGVVPVKDK
jgi:hypothetical protein